MIKEMMGYFTNLNTEIKVVNDTVFSATKGDKKWKLLGITFFSKNYNEIIGNIEFLDKDSESGEIGFNKLKNKKG